MSKLLYDDCHRRWWAIRRNADSLYDIHLAIPWKIGRESGVRYMEPIPQHRNFKSEAEAAEFLLEMEPPGFEEWLATTAVAPGNPDSDRLIAWGKRAYEAGRRSAIPETQP